MRKHKPRMVNWRQKRQSERFDRDIEIENSHSFDAAGDLIKLHHRIDSLEDKLGLDPDEK